MEISVKIKNEKGTISPGHCTRTANIYCNLLYRLCWLCTLKKTTAEIQSLNEDNYGHHSGNCNLSNGKLT